MGPDPILILDPFCIHIFFIIFIFLLFSAAATDLIATLCPAAT